MANNISITKNDVFWGYIAQFFSIASGLITLPLILRMLSSEEIGMNYLMLTISSFVSLFDFGFAPQFGRNITYVFSGAQELKREGVEFADNSIGVNYQLLSTMISVAKSVYRILALFVLLFMLSVGTLYIYNVTNGFLNVHNSFIIWIVYSVSIFFNVYYTYYTSLLTGKGLIKESKKAMLASRIAYIALTIIFLLMGAGLLGVAIANLISPFVSRFLSYRYFFNIELIQKMNGCNATKEEKIKLFKVIWFNARKLGLVFVGSYGINKLGMFLAGLYLSLNEIASYGLMIQLMSVITVISITLFSVSEPYLSSLRIENKKEKLIRCFSFTMNVYYLLFIAGCLFLIFMVPFLLNVIGSNVKLPSISLLLLYSIIVLLENNHSSFATFIVTENKIPFVESSLIAGIAIALGSFLSLKHTSLGLLGLVLVQGICQLAYANWKWPFVVCKQFKISFIYFLKLGFQETNNKIKKTLL